MEHNRGLCCGFEAAGGLWWGILGASMAVEKGGSGDNVERMPAPPRQGLFLLSRATDESQMDDQLLWVSEPRKGGRLWGRWGHVLRSWYAGQGGTSVWRCRLKEMFSYSWSLSNLITKFYFARRGFYCWPEGSSRCSGSLDLDKWSQTIHLPVFIHSLPPLSEEQLKGHLISFLYLALNLLIHPKHQTVSLPDGLPSRWTLHVTKRHKKM